jgi:hypothetical protein
MPLASRPIQIVRTCGTVMSMVKTERPRKTLSRGLSAGEPSGAATQDPSAGSIVVSAFGRPTGQ